MMVHLFAKYFDGDFELHGKRRFHEHYNMVRALAPEGQLLEYRVQDGWGPLCDFLGAKTPATAFPNGNTKAEMDQKVKELVGGEIHRLSQLAIQIAASVVGLLLVMYLAQTLVVPLERTALKALILLSPSL